MKLSNLYLFSALIMALGISSCAKQKSSVTGWNYNDTKNGGFQVVKNHDQATGPGLVFVEGGTFTMGYTEDDVWKQWDAVPRTVTVSSFYMDETEIANVHYREYVYWMNRTFG